MSRKTKAELEKEVEILKGELDKQIARPLGTTISGCHFEVGKDLTKIAVAEAVKEGMKALQSLGGPSYGIYLSGGSDKQPLEEP